MQPKRIRVGARLGFRPPVFSLLVLFLAGTSAAQEFPGREHVVGGPLGSVGMARVADLDGDGIADAVAALGQQSSLAVFLGLGHGAFGAPSLYPCASVPTSLVLGDLDGDGRVDALAPLRNAGQVARLLGDGAGGLGAVATFAAGVHPNRAALGDLNGDGALDVVTTNQPSDNNFLPFAMGVLLSNGAGGFAAPVFWELGQNAYFEPAVGDLNGDGALDVVVASSKSWSSALWYFSVFLGNGAGALAPAPNLSSITGWSPPVIADVDQDGVVDIAQSGSGVEVLRGLGGGAFAPPVFSPLGDASLVSEDLHLAD